MRLDRAAAELAERPHLVDQLEAEVHGRREVLELPRPQPDPVPLVPDLGVAVEE